MLKNLKIGVKLFILVALLGALLVLVGLIGLRGMQAGDAALDTVYNDRVVPLRDLKVIADMYAVNIVDTVHKARNGSLSNAAAIKNIDTAGATIKKKWHDYLATFLVDEEKLLVSQITPLMEIADRDTARVRVILETGTAAQLAEFATKSLYPAIDPVSDRFSALIEVQLRVAKQAYDENQALYALSRQRMIALILGALVAGLGIGIAIIRSITQPLTYVCGLIERMARGELNIEVRDDGSRDETGQMVRATAEIARTLKAVAKDLRDMIEAARVGALSVRAESTQHQGEFAQLVQGVNDLLEVLTAPLFEVAGVMARLASGDVRGRMTGAYEGDLRALKGNVNRSLDALVTLLDEISGFATAMAGGDLTGSITGSYQGDFAAIKVNLNKAVAQLRAVLQSVGRSTQDVANSANETTAAAVDVSRQAASQMTTLADVSSAIEQTVAAIAEIARSADRGSVLGRSAAATAEDGRAKLTRLTDAVDSIAAKNTRISQISDLIAAIADKTYVLALNAGLEAVRAGDHGRGFGLIAHKITTLAEEVAVATRDIRILVDETTESVKSGVAAAGEARTSIDHIVGTSRESGETVQAIAAAIDEQNAMAQVLKERVMHLHMVGQTTAGAAEEISATMASLTSMARDLKTETDRIRTA
ncbi:MAG: MCP four helix bundle domain-containing protein [Rhodospirillaceae bacterium]